MVDPRGGDSADFGFLRAKKNETLKIIERINQLRQAYQQQLQAMQLPEGLVYRFDTQTAEGRVEKTTSRCLVTLDKVQFQAIQVHRHPATTDSSSRSTLDHLVPKGGTYGYDVIAHVGCETFLNGRPLEDLARELPHIPFSCRKPDIRSVTFICYATSVKVCMPILMSVCDDACDN